MSWVICIQCWLTDSCDSLTRILKIFAEAVPFLLASQFTSSVNIEYYRWTCFEMTNRNESRYLDKFPKKNIGFCHSKLKKDKFIKKTPQISNNFGRWNECLVLYKPNKCKLCLFLPMKNNQAIYYRNRSENLWIKRIYESFCEVDHRWIHFEDTFNLEFYKIN